MGKTVLFINKLTDVDFVLTVIGNHVNELFKTLIPDPHI